MLRTRFRVPGERVGVVLTPIDLDRFAPVDRAEACHRAGLPPARRYVLYVGRLDDATKRVTALVRAFAAAARVHDDVDLVVVGDGQDRKRVHALAHRIVPGRVRLPGWVSGPEALRDLYSAAECLVLPSWREGFPTVVGEAMACGLPVLASDVGGVGELVIEGETGWLVAPGDDPALTEKLGWVLDHRKEVGDFRRRARRVAEERLDPSHVVAALRRGLTPPRRRPG